MQAEPFRGIQRRHADRFDRIDAKGDGAADHLVDRPGRQQLHGRAVVGAEADAAAVGGRDDRQQGVQFALVASRISRYIPRASFSRASSGLTDS